MDVTKQRQRNLMTNENDRLEIRLNNYIPERMNHNQEQNCRIGDCLPASNFENAKLATDLNLELFHDLTGFINLISLIKLFAVHVM